MLAKSETELGSWLLGKVVDTTRNRGLVGEETRDTTLVLGSSATDEAAVIDDTVLWGVSLGLESTEQRLLLSLIHI